MSPQPNGTDAVIVLIDDDPDDLRLLQRQLSKSGLPQRVVAFSNAAVAIEAFRGGPQVASAVFCDMKMPGMDGFDFLGVARNETAFADAVVIIISGCALESDVERARWLGADGFLEKLPSTDALVQMLREPSFPAPGTRQERFRSWEGSRSRTLAHEPSVR